MTPTWDPTQYLKFHGPRLRPALDLLARVALDTPGAVYDLGCGPGNVTGFLQARWPAATVTGVDTSAEMLAEARRQYPEGTWLQADLATWAPEQPADVCYSNAVLQWLGDHARLLPALAGHLRPGGILAVQMPRNWAAPSHTAIGEAAEESPWAEQLRPHVPRDPVAEPGAYYDILRPHVRELDIWETEYLQVLEGDNAVAEWTRGTALKPLLDVLDDEARRAFFAAYSRKTRAHYPRRADGKTLYPFRRLFIVASR